MLIKKIYYRNTKAIARLIYPKRKVIYDSDNDNESAVYVCNHSRTIGPLNMTLHFDKPAKSWIIEYVFDKRVGPNFVFHDFFCGRAKKHNKLWRWLSRKVANIIRPLLEENNSIKVYKNSLKIKETFNESIEALKDNKNLVIFPESHVKYSEYINKLCDGFADVARYYYIDTGKFLKFYPTYIGEKFKTINVGKPIQYNPDEDKRVERKKIAYYLQCEIDKIAKSLPEHKPITFASEDFYNYYNEYVENDKEYWDFVGQVYSE